MYATLSGSVMLFNAVQPRNTPTANVVIVSGIVISAKLVQF